MTIKQEIDDLVEAFKKEEVKLAEGTPPASLHIISLHDKYKHLLTSGALAALEIPIHSTLHSHQRNEPILGTDEYIRRVDYTRSIFLSVIARSMEEVDTAARLLYNEINKLALWGLLKGHLALLSSISLVEGTRHYRNLHEYVCPEGTTRSYAIFVFPHVPAEWKVEGVDFESAEGEFGRYLDINHKPIEPIHAPDCRTCKVVHPEKK